MQTETQTVETIYAARSLKISVQLEILRLIEDYEKQTGLQVESVELERMRYNYGEPERVSLVLLEVKL